MINPLVLTEYYLSVDNALKKSLIEDLSSKLEQEKKGKSNRLIFCFIRHGLTQNEHP